MGESGGLGHICNFKFMLKIRKEYDQKRKDQKISEKTRKDQKRVWLVYKYMGESGDWDIFAIFKFMPKISEDRERPRYGAPMLQFASNHTGMKYDKKIVSN